MVLTHVVDANLARRTVVVGRTIPSGTLVVLTDLAITLGGGCRIVRGTPARWTALTSDTLVAVGASLAGCPGGTVVGANLCCVAATAACSGLTATGSARPFLTVLAGLTGVVVVPLHTSRVTHLNARTVTATCSRCTQAVLTSSVCTSL